MYVTGQNLAEVISAIKKNGLPEPLFVASEVGTRIFIRACAVFVGTDEKGFAKSLLREHPEIHISNRPQIFGVVKGLRLCGFMPSDN